MNIKMDNTMNHTMDLIVDDRECKVISYLEHVMQFEVKRITTGDFIFIFRGKIIAVIERKTLKDLSSSIKDGRMHNNNKLLEMNKETGCLIIYIIEGPQYPSSNRKFAGIPFKNLQAKLDSIMFQNDIKIIWTKDAKHTAERLLTINKQLYKIYNKKITEGGGDYKLINKKHEMSIDRVHIEIIKCIKGMSYKSITAILKIYKFIDIFNKNIDEKECYNCIYPDSGNKLGNRGTAFYKTIMNMNDDIKLHIKMLSCIKGISKNIAEDILNNIPFNKICSLDLNKNDISNIIKRNNKRVGNSIEKKIYMTFE